MKHILIILVFLGFHHHLFCQQTDLPSNIFTSDADSLRQEARVRGVLASFPKMQEGASSGMTNLMLASREGNLTRVAGYIEAGASANITDTFGQTALHHAAAAGQTPVAIYLLENGARPTIEDVSGQNAMHKAAYGGVYEVIRPLVEFGLMVDKADKYGRTPLMLAALQHEFKTVEKLFENGANAAIVDNQGNSFAHYWALGFAKRKQTTVFVSQDEPELKPANEAPQTTEENSLQSSKKKSLFARLVNRKEKSVEQGNDPSDDKQVRRRRSTRMKSDQRETEVIATSSQNEPLTNQALNNFEGWKSLFADHQVDWGIRNFVRKSPIDLLLEIGEVEIADQIVN